MPSQAPADSSPVEWRTNTAIAVGMAMPIAALGVLSWIEPAVGARLASSSTTAAAAAAAAPVPVAGTGRVQKPRQSRVEVVATYPHDKSASTEGLHYEGGVLYESIGGDGQSSLRRVDLKTGRVLQSVPLATGMVGEGLARTPSGLVQLTWRHQTGFVYDQRTLAVLRSFTYPGEGKGLCYDGTSLVMSDGSDALTFRRPDTFEVQRTLRIVKDGVPMPKISELECVNGAVYANVWLKVAFYRIDPWTGVVTERIEAAGLLSDTEAEGVDVLNGIAYDPADGLFYITGKRWPKLFKVRVVPKEES